MSELFTFDAPERVTAGAVGPPGRRVFYLQARQLAELLTLRLEKQQLAALAERLGELLQDLPRPGHLPEEDELDLEEFEEEAFVVGALALAYDADADRVVLLADELAEEDTGAQARLSLTREQASALAIRGTRLVAAGRPSCPLCGYPLDPRGHACPRTNGNHPPLT